MHRGLNRKNNKTNEKVPTDHEKSVGTVFVRSGHVISDSYASMAIQKLPAGRVTVVPVTLNF